MKAVGFFNVKKDVGTTTLVYHLAWMYQELGITTVVLDLDPQADLTTAFQSEADSMEMEGQSTIDKVVERAWSRSFSVHEQDLLHITQNIGLLAGNLELSSFEDRFAEAWSEHDQGKLTDADGVFRILTAFRQVSQQAAQLQDAPLTLIDVGPGVNAINRSAILACDSIVIPFSTNLSSLQSVRAVSSSLRKWRSGWTEGHLQGHAPSDLAVTAGAMEPIGYVILQLRVRLDSHAELVQQLVEGLSGLYHGEVLREQEGTPVPDVDPHKLAVLKYYPSLMTLAKAVGKPMFLLKPADGAIGGHAEAVLDCYRDFKHLAIRIAAACGIEVPS